MKLVYWRWVKFLWNTRKLTDAQFVAELHGIHPLKHPSPEEISRALNPTPDK